MKNSLSPSAMIANRPSLNTMNRLYMGFVLGLPAVTGSVVSFFVAGAFLWALFRLLRRDFGIPAIPEIRFIAWVFAAFVLVEALSGAVSFNGFPTINEVVENALFLAYLPIYSRLAVSRREDVREAVELAVAGGAFAAFVLTLIDILIRGRLAEGGAGNPTPFAIACLVLYAIAVLAALRADGRKRLLFGVAAAAAAACVMLAGVRALWPPLLLVPLVAALIYGRQISRRQLAYMGGTLVVLIGLFAVAFSGTVAGRINKALADVDASVSGENFSGSFGQRLIMWKSGLELFAEAPILGHGPGNAQALLTQKTAPYFDKPLTYSHFHNVVITYGVRDGILGIVAVLALVAVPLILAARHKRDEVGQYGLAFTSCAAVIYLSNGIFTSMIGHDIMDAVFVVSMIYGTFMVFGSGPEWKGARPSTATGHS